MLKALLGNWMSTTGLTFNWETEKLTSNDKIVAQGRRYDRQLAKTEEEYIYTSMVHLANKKNLVKYMVDKDAASAITGFSNESAEVCLVPDHFLSRISNIAALFMWLWIVCWKTADIFHSQENLGKGFYQPTDDGDSMLLYEDNDGELAEDEEVEGSLNDE